MRCQKLYKFSLFIIYYLLFIVFLYGGALDKKISISFSNATIEEVCSELSKVSGINIVCDVDYTGTFTQQFNDLGLGDILDYVCDKANCLVKEEKANLIKVYKVPDVKMEFKETPFINAITAIAKQAGINIVLDEEVVKSQKTITATGESVPFEEALKILSNSAGFYIIEEKFKIFRITTLARLAEQLETRSFKLKYIRPQTYVRATIKTDYAQTSPPSSEQSKDFFTFMELVQSVMTKGTDGKTLIGTINYDDKTNTLIVKDTKIALKKIEELIAETDVEPGEILIDVYFITTTNEDLFRVGVNYSTSAPIGDNEGWTFTATIPSIDESTETGQQPRRSVIPFGFGHTSIRFDNIIGRPSDFLNATLRLFRKDEQSKVIQQPTILALNHHEATIFVGDTIRWAEATTSVSGTSGTPVTTLAESSKSPVQVGFQLLVIPHIIPMTNKIQMTVIPQNSSLIGTSTELPGFDKFTSGSQTIFLPRTRSSTLVTNLIVESGQTAVLGGLVSQNSTKGITKVPFFGDIPLIGELFKFRDRSNTRVHLLIYITPTILKSTDMMSGELKRRIEKHKEELNKEYERLKNKDNFYKKEKEDFEERHKKELEKEYEKLRHR